MGVKEFLSQDANGKVRIDCAKLPDKAFIDVVRTKEVAYAKMLTRQEKLDGAYKNGDPDVILRLITGEIKRITRKQFVADYRHVNGKKIVLSILHSGREYLVMKQCNDRYKAMKLPINCYGVFNGKAVQSDNYIVGKANADGLLEASTISIVPVKLFRKMFKVPMQAQLRNYQHRGNKSNTFKLFDRHKHRNQQQSQEYKQEYKQEYNDVGVNVGLYGNKPLVDTSELNINASRINIEPVQQITQQRQQIQQMQQGNFGRPVEMPSRLPNIQSRLPNIQSSLIENSNYKYTVINRVVDLHNRLLGYTVKELSTGATRVLKPQELMILCKKKTVNNVMAVHKDANHLYLKGNGIRLEALPSVIMQ